MAERCLSFRARGVCASTARVAAGFPDLIPCGVVLWSGLLTRPLVPTAGLLCRSTRDPRSAGIFSQEETCGRVWCRGQETSTQRHAPHRRGTLQVPSGRRDLLLRRDRKGPFDTRDVALPVRDGDRHSTALQPCQRPRQLQLPDTLCFLREAGRQILAGRRAVHGEVGGDVEAGAVDAAAVVVHAR